MNSAVISPQPNPRFDATASHRLQGPLLHIAHAVWGAIIAVMVVTIIASIPLRIQNIHQSALSDMMVGTTLGLSPAAVGAFLLVMDTLSVAIWVGVALVLFRRRTNDWYVMLLSIMLATFGGAVINYTGLLPLIESGPLFGALITILATLGNATFTFFIYTFPNGRFKSPLAAVIGPLGILWMIASTLTNYCSAIGVPLLVVNLGMFVVYLLSLILQIGPLRHSENPAEWQQAKWIVNGLIIALIGFALTSVIPSLFPRLHQPGMEGLAYGIVQQVILFFTLIAVPISISFSISKYRLWEVDLFLNRSLVFGLLTAILLLLTVVDLFAIQRLALMITGQEQAPYALAGAALISGALFQPARRFLQRLVDRQLYGIGVDARAEEARDTTHPRLTSGLSGHKLGPYEVLEPIGRGGMAEVYLGRHPTLDRQVAIKVLLADRASEEDFKARFEREARSVAGLRHPNIIDIFDYGVEDDLHYMVMTYVDGMSLSTYLRQNEILSMDEAAGLLGDIASALDVAHMQGVVHRDVKPSNVMLQRATTASGSGGGLEAILTDFGIARMMGGATALTKTGMVGTLDYIAPEQIRDAKTVDGRADVYSLGVMAFEMLTGQLPFVGSNPGAILISHLQQPPPDPRELRSDLPETASRAIGKALAKQPEARFETAGAFVSALKGVGVPTV